MTGFNQFEISESVHERYPGASAGILVIAQVANPKKHAGLEARKAQLIADLRSRYASETRQTLREIAAFAAYHQYYKSFRKTYHVQHQLESVIFKARSLPTVAALVEAMFMAELKNHLLTAGHDLDQVELPVRLDVAAGNERYRRINRQDQMLKAGDLYITDQAGILSSILYGPDHRTRITPTTRRAIFTVYMPPGITKAMVAEHMKDIAEYVTLISPSARIEAQAAM